MNCIHHEVITSLPSGGYKGVCQLCGREVKYLARVVGRLKGVEGGLLLTVKIIKEGKAAPKVNSAPAGKS